MTATHHDATCCPMCATRLDRSECISDPDLVPQVGSVTLCIGCGCLLQFDEQMLLRRWTRWEYDKLTPEEKTDIVSLRRLIPLKIVLTVDWRFRP